MYLVKTPFWLRAIYPTLTWQMPTNEKVLYLTFDDGPNAIATPFVLNTLRQHNAKATFFCIGKNVVQQPAIYQQIIAEGHSVGNHTFHHLNGWKTHPMQYIKDVVHAAEHIHSKLFRPPYGRISKRQMVELQGDAKQTQVSQNHYSIIMWSVLSGDFDVRLSNEKCLKNVVKNSSQGSIVVFHDSDKAFSKLQYALPKTLAHFANLGYRFEAIPQP